MRTALALLLFACGGTPVRPDAPSTPFDDDVAFLRAHHDDLIVLERGDARVAIAPDYQGRVMTSTAGSASFGWINRELIASGELRPHMNAFGGEDRFWLGPEGGPYALYFPPGAPLEFDRWQVPPALDTEPWELVSSSATEATFTHPISITNRAGTALSMRATRTIRLLDPGMPNAVEYESVNTIENTGDAAWNDSTGLVSIWILSMYTPSPSTTVVIPFRANVEGPAPVNDAYFGPVPADRLRITDGVVFFRADGRARGKIGIPHGRAREVMGSWDAARGALTIVHYTLPEHAPGGYVNSMWSDDAAPYEGDVVNSYNDGPPAPGEPPLGPFYELESSSPAAALAPGERIEHTHRTLHVEGDRARLDAIAREELGVGLDEIEAAFGSHAAAE